VSPTLCYWDILSPLERSSGEEKSQYFLANQMTGLDSGPLSPDLPLSKVLLGTNLRWEIIQEELRVLHHLVANCHGCSCVLRGITIGDWTAGYAASYMAGILIQDRVGGYWMPSTRIFLIFHDQCKPEI